MKRSLILVVVLFPLLGLAALLHTARLQASPAQSGGVTFTVNSTIDATDANPGDGVCETAVGNGICTLRAAVQETNANSGTNTIYLPGGIYTMTISGRNEDDAVTGDLDVRSNVNIVGENTTTTMIDGNDLDRIFHIHPNVNVNISSMIVTNGHASGDGKGSLGFGGGIFNQGTLTLERIYLTHNVADGKLNSMGGGLVNTFVAEINNSTISNNNSNTIGGGFTNEGIITLTNSTIMGNYALSSGGGISLRGGSKTTIVNSSIISNTVETQGGGIHSYSYSGEIHLEILNSTVSNNQAYYGEGGGLYIGPISFVSLTNSTISLNIASSTGGITNWGGVLTVTNSTIYSNIGYPSGALSTNTTTFIGHTIIAGSTFANCTGSSPIISLGHNLSSDDTCNLTGTGDLINTAPTLGSLQDNGGGTWTHALLVGSPAIDAGDNATCPATDQRGGIRPIDGDGDDDPVCDIGAYELGGLQLTAVPDLITTTQNTPILIDVLANDIPSEDGNPMLETVGVPTNGTAVITNTLVLYTPDLDFIGTDTFTYTITDGVLTDTTVVTVTVLPLIAPTAVDDTAETSQNEPILIDVLANDLPGSSGDPALDSVGEPGNGTAVITDTFILYTPAPDFVGTDTFTYTITDGVLTDTAVVTVTVQPLIAPTAVDDTAETLAGEPVLIDVLANDLPGSSGDPALDSVGAPGNGTAVITNTFILYTPAPDFVGTDTFTYTITDGVLTDTAVVSVTILPVDKQTYIYLPVVLKP